MNAPATAAKAPTVTEQITAMLPDHTHVQRNGLSTSWQWTTAGGRWDVVLTVEILLQSRIRFVGIGAEVELPATTVGVLALKGVLLALRAIQQPTGRVPEPTPMGLCEVCGEPTSTPPECEACALRADATAVRRADR